MLVYKVVDQDQCTTGRTQWVVGEWKTAPGGGGMCNERWLHAYPCLLTASLLGPWFGRLFKGPKLFAAEAGGDIQYGVDKIGATKMRIIEEIEPIEINDDLRSTVAILFLSQFKGPEGWYKWSWEWLLDINRTKEAGKELAKYALGRAELERAFGTDFGNRMLQGAGRIIESTFPDEKRSELAALGMSFICGIITGEHHMSPQEIYQSLPVNHR